MDEYLRFENAIFCSSNCNFFKIFCSQHLFITGFYFYDALHLQLSIPRCGISLSLTLCLNLIIPNITPGGLFSGGLIHGRNFPFQKLVPKRPGLINGGAYYRNLRYYMAMILRAF